MRVGYFIYSERLWWEWFVLSIFVCFQSGFEALRVAKANGFSINCGFCSQVYVAISQHTALQVDSCQKKKRQTVLFAAADMLHLINLVLIGKTREKDKQLP